MQQRIGWPDRLILQDFLIVVSRDQCKEWYTRIEAGEKPLVLGLLPPVSKQELQHVSVQIKLSTLPLRESQRGQMFAESRYVN